MYLSLLLSLLAVQGPKLTSVQAGTITRSVVSYLIPFDKPVGNIPIAGRTVAFDQAQSIKAWTPFVDKVNPRDIMPTLPSLIRTRDAAITCVHGTRECTVVENAIFVSIDAVSTRDVRPGEYRIDATLLWAQKDKAGKSELHGGNYSLVLGLAGGKYKYWKVLRADHRPVR